jgi:predicted nucleic acid-binding protein
MLTSLMNELVAQPRIFIDTSVLIAGSFSKAGASYILLQLAGLTLLDGRISPDVRTEALRNVAAKLPAALPQLRVMLNDVLTEGAPVTAEQMEMAAHYADPKDRPILASAIAQQCRYLVTLNEKDFWPPPGRILIVRPGDLLRALRVQLAGV